MPIKRSCLCPTAGLCERIRLPPHKCPSAGLVADDLEAVAFIEDGAILRSLYPTSNREDIRNVGAPF